MYLVTLVWRFCSCDLDFDPTTFMYELCLYILKIRLSTKLNFPRKVFKSTNRTDTQTNGQTDATECITATFPRGNKTLHLVRH